MNYRECFQAAENNTNIKILKNTNRRKWKQTATNFKPENNKRK